MLTREALWRNGLEKCDGGIMENPFYGLFSQGMDVKGDFLETGHIMLFLLTWN